LRFAIWSLASSGLRSGAKRRLFDPAHSTNHARRHISLESHGCSQCPNCWGPGLRSTEHPSGVSRLAHHLGLNIDAIGTGSRARLRNGRRRSLPVDRSCRPSPGGKSIWAARSVGRPSAGTCGPRLWGPRTCVGCRNVPIQCVHTYTLRVIRQALAAGVK
jgi:hypothetical protein